MLLHRVNAAKAQLTRHCEKPGAGGEILKILRVSEEIYTAILEI